MEWRPVWRKIWEKECPSEVARDQHYLEVEWMQIDGDSFGKFGKGVWEFEEQQRVGNRLESEIACRSKADSRQAVRLYGGRLRGREQDGEGCDDGEEGLVGPDMWQQ